MTCQAIETKHSQIITVLAMTIAQLPNGPLPGALLSYGCTAVLRDHHRFGLSQPPNNVPGLLEAGFLNLAGYQT